MKNRFVLLAVLSLFCLSITQQEGTAQSKPNFVIIFADDLGYGDLGCFGSTILTPELDKMAAEGQKWNNFYASSSVCTPSRAGLQTGRLPIRSGMCSSERRVLFPDSEGGLPQTEVTIAAKLKEAGYATAAVGKWHLGHLKQYLPTSHGYDSYYGIPYSNDMDRVGEVKGYEACYNPKNEYFQVPMMQNEEILTREVDQHLLTKNYTEKAVQFIGENKDKPFFLYLAHSMPHVPLFASAAFEGKSNRGIYGDVIQEIDWSVGQIRKALAENGVDKNTLIVFTSDNGPWVIYKDHGGSAGMLYGAKGTGYEGGMREPTIFCWPDKLKQGTVDEMGSTLDLFPTITKLAGLEVPNDRKYDGYDISNVLFKGTQSKRNEIFYYHGTEIFAARKGDYKLLYSKNNPDGYPQRIEPLAKMQLYNISLDPGEKYDVADEHPEVIAEIKKMVEEHVASVEPVENQLNKRMKPANQQGTHETSKSIPMIRHTVAFTLKYPKGSSEESKFLAEGAKLSDIPGVLNFESLHQTSPKNDFDYGFSMEFESMDAYEGYNQHPDHVNFVQTYWVNSVEKFLEVDYESLTGFYSRLQANSDPKNHQKTMKSSSKPKSMIRHTVAFTLKHPKGSTEENEFFTAGAKLSDIPGVLNFESLRQTSPKNDFDYGFSMEFESMDAYEGYNQDPYHVKFVQTFWADYVDKFLEIDYEPLK